MSIIKWDLGDVSLVLKGFSIHSIQRVHLNGGEDWRGGGCWNDLKRNHERRRKVVEWISLGLHSLVTWLSPPKYVAQVNKKTIKSVVTAASTNNLPSLFVCPHHST